MLLIILFSATLCGYFSDNVTNIITTKAKLESDYYIERVIKEEVLKEEYALFYKSVGSDGLTNASFDVAKANLLVVNSMSKLRKISKEFNINNDFDVEVPISYLFIPNSYFLPNMRLKVETSSLLYYDVKLKSDIKEYGINSSLVNLSLIINISYQVIVPLMIKIIDNEIEVPIAMEIINGKVPDVLFTY